MARVRLTGGAPWSTKDEINFIDHIGEHKDDTMGELAVTARQYRILLEKYAQAIKKRVNWGNLDEKKIKKYVKEKLLTV